MCGPAHHDLQLPGTQQTSGTLIMETGLSKRSISHELKPRARGGGQEAILLESFSRTICSKLFQYFPKWAVFPYRCEERLLFFCASAKSRGCCFDTRALAGSSRAV